MLEHLLYLQPAWVKEERLLRLCPEVKAEEEVRRLTAQEAAEVAEVHEQKEGAEVEELP